MWIMATDGKQWINTTRIERLRLTNNRLEAIVGAGAAAERVVLIHGDRAKCEALMQRITANGAAPAKRGPGRPPKQ